MKMSTEPNEAYERGKHDAIQDRCENVPFASVGGLDRRDNMTTPEYIDPSVVEDYLRGYREACCEMFDEDWQTCEFGWRPAVELMSGQEIDPRPLVLYHAHCTDGFTAAWVAESYLGSCEKVAVSYGDDPPDVTGREVYVVDFSYSRDILVEMHEKAKTLLVLDHHKTARAALDGLDFCKFDMCESGASLTERHFFGPGPHSPLVEYVRDRDLWAWELPYSREISAYIASWPFEMEIWDMLSRQVERQPLFCAAAGESILREQKRLVDSYVPRAHLLMLAGVPFIVANCGADKLFSEVAEVLSEKTGAGAVWFYRADGRVQWSLRAWRRDGVDVSEVASTFEGGGGHRSAAGFNVSLDEHVRILTEGRR